MSIAPYKKDIIDILSSTFSSDRLVVDEELIECFTEVFLNDLNRNLKLALESKRQMFRVNKYDLFYHYRVLWNYKVPNITFDAQKDLYGRVLPFILFTLKELDMKYCLDAFTSDIIFQVRDLKDLVKSNEIFII